MNRLIMLVSLLVVSLSPEARAESSDDVFNAIERSWKEREAKAESVHVAWKATRVVPAGWVSTVLWGELGERRGEPVPKGTVPPRLTTLTAAVTLDLQKVKCLCTEPSWSWHAKRDEFVYSPVTTLYDGKISRHLSPHGVAEMTWPQAHVRAASPSQFAGLPQLRPLFQTFRPFGSYRTFDVRSFQLATASQGGKDQDLMLVKESGRSTNTLWLRPSQGYSLVRETLVVKGVVLQQFRIDHRQDGKLGWVPQKWELVTRSFNGKLAETSKGEVTLIRSGPIGDESFVLPFPAGTRVLDETRPENSQNYITRADASDRIIPPGEFGKAYSELLESEPEGRRWLGKGAWAASLLLLAVTSVAAWVALKWRRRCAS